jgi:hypothetical protein
MTSKVKKPYLDITDSVETEDIKDGAVTSQKLAETYVVNEGIVSSLVGITGSGLVKKVGDELEIDTRVLSIAGHEHSPSIFSRVLDSTSTPLTKANIRCVVMSDDGTHVYVVGRSPSGSILNVSHDAGVTFESITGQHTVDNAQLDHVSCSIDGSVVVIIDQYYTQNAYVSFDSGVTFNLVTINTGYLNGWKTSCFDDYGNMYMAGSQGLAYCQYGSTNFFITAFPGESLWNVAVSPSGVHVVTSLSDNSGSYVMNTFNSNSVLCPEIKSSSGNIKVNNSGVIFFNNNNGAVGISTDGGRTTTLIPLVVSGDIFVFNDMANALITDSTSGSLYESIDLGATISFPPIYTNNSFNGLTFVTSNRDGSHVYLIDEMFPSTLVHLVFRHVTNIPITFEKGIILAETDEILIPPAGYQGLNVNTSGKATLTNSTGETQVIGNSLTRVFTGVSIVADDSNVLTHDLNTINVNVTVRDESDDTEVEVPWKPVSVTQVRISSTAAFTATVKLQA